MEFIKSKCKEIAIWLAYFLLLFTFAHENWGSLQNGAEVSFFMVSMHFLVFYGNYHLLMPYTFAKQRYVLFVLGTVLFAASWFFIANAVFSLAFESGHWVSPEITRLSSIEQYPSIEKLWAARITLSGFNVFFISILYYYAERDKKRKQQLWDMEHEKVNAEIKLLRMQINPHFLFNALNNIYSKAVLEESKVADSIHKLSNLLRYTLYDCDTDRIALTKELEYIDNYIDLQKLKDNELDSIDLLVEGNIMAVRIAPMILIAFVENAFKHGNIADGGWIKIKIEVTKDELCFFCGNSIANTSLVKEDSFGIGLENVQKRLKLYYPNKHQFSVYKGETEFEIKLIINDY